MANSPYRTVLSCIRRIYATEGLAAFYRSYRTTLLMNVPFQSIHFVTYEFTQSITNPHRTYDPTAHVVSGMQFMSLFESNKSLICYFLKFKNAKFINKGAMAGAVAATVSMPLDVCKTLLNTQTGEVRATGMVHALGLVYRYWGLPGYFRGLSARVVYQMPATAICWST